MKKRIKGAFFEILRGSAIIFAVSTFISIAHIGKKNFSVYSIFYMILIDFVASIIIMMSITLVLWILFKVFAYFGRR